MKETGEVMAIEQNLTASLQKAIRSLELEVDGIKLTALQSETTIGLQKLVMNVDDQRFFAILELLRRGYSMENITKTTKIDRYFLKSMQTLVQLEQMAERITKVQAVTLDQLIAFEEAVLTHEWLAKTGDCSIADMTEKVQAADLHLTYKEINGMTEENEAAGYFYSVGQTKVAP